MIGAKNNGAKVNVLSSVVFPVQLSTTAYLPRFVYWAVLAEETVSGADPIGAPAYAG
jgi:hypothetical protein